MIGGQKQESGENAVAVQVGAGNVTINHGMSIVQMGEIMIELQKMFVAFTADAQETAAERVDNLRQELLKKFSQPDQANPEAFKDPDFQFLYRRAQEHYARDGNDVTSDLLVELLAERSKIPKRDRIALILNEATEKIGKLTDEDVAILSLTFLFYQTGGGASDYDSLVRHYRTFAAPFVKEIRPETSAYAYLESLGCVSINRLTGHDLGDLIFSNYDLLFAESFDLDDLLLVVPDLEEESKLITLLVQRQKMAFKPFAGNPLAGGPKASVTTPTDVEWRFRQVSTNVLRSDLLSIGFSEQNVNDIIEFVVRKNLSKVDAMTKLSNDVPEIKELLSVWSSTDLQRTNLTSVGLVIGHASLSKQATHFNAPLSTWIK